ncbi:NADPH:quinone oxidoreductase family protein [Angustibacter speluncae]
MSPPAQMQAWQVVVHGSPADALRLQEVEVPRPGAGQVLLRVAATALNFPDVLLAAGQYQVRPPLPFTPGVEACGEVVAVGDGADPALVGARVLGMLALPHGGLATYALADAGAVHVAPPSLDDAAAASLYIGYQTAWFALHRRARLQPGETVLVHAAAGGVGSATVQLAKAAGARVVGVVGGAAKVEVARDLGCDDVVDRTVQDDLVPVLREVLGRGGADVVVDPVGGPAYDDSTKVVAFEGRIVVVGFTSGRIAQAATNHVLVKNYAVLGLHWGEYHRHDPQSVRDCHAELVRLAGEGVVRPLVSERVPLAEVPDALTRLAAGRTTGRVVVEVGR